MKDKTYIYSIQKELFCQKMSTYLSYKVAFSLFVKKQDEENKKVKQQKLLHFQCIRQNGIFELLSLLSLHYLGSKYLRNHCQSWSIDLDRFIGLWNSISIHISSSILKYIHI